MKRIVLIVVALALLFPFFVTAAGQGGTAATGAEEVLKIRVASRMIKDRMIQHTPYHHKVALEKFNMEFELEQIPEAAYDEKITVLVAAKDYPDYLCPKSGGNISLDNRNRWGVEGHIIPMSDYFDQMPDYMRHWTGEYEEYWNQCLQFSRAPDGKVYFLPLTNKGYYQLYRIGWVYRGDIFEKHGLEFPDTMVGLIDVMKQLKELYPESMPMANRNGLNYFLWGARFAYRTDASVHFDVDTGELVYGPGTDKYRKVIAWATEVYENGLVDPEFATATFQQYREILATGKNFIEHQWTTNAPHFLTQTVQEANPNAYWTYTKYGISGIPGKESIVDKGLPYVTAGAVIMRTDQEKVDRLIEYLNWSATDEGMIAHQYGEPGVTMQMVRGVPRMLTTDGAIIDSWEVQEKARAEGKLIANHDYNLKGPHPSGAVYNWYYPEAAINPPEGVVNAQVVADDLETVHKDRDFIARIPWDFTKTEDKDRADVQTVVNDTYQEYALKFIMGDLDINDDGDWEDYQAALKKAGVERLLALYQKAYDRIEW